MPEGAPSGIYRLAGGAVGIQAAINEAPDPLSDMDIYTGDYNRIYPVLIISFRSIFAGYYHHCSSAVFKCAGIYFYGVFNNPPLPLTTATLPVASVGIGLGVDYGIYLVSRIMEEYQDPGYPGDGYNHRPGYNR